MEISYKMNVCNNKTKYTWMELCLFLAYKDQIVAEFKQKSKCYWKDLNSLQSLKSFLIILTSAKRRMHWFWLQLQSHLTQIWPKLKSSMQCIQWQNKKFWYNWKQHWQSWLQNIKRLPPSRQSHQKANEQRQNKVKLPTWPNVTGTAGNSYTKTEWQGTTNRPYTIMRPRYVQKHWRKMYYWIGLSVHSNDIR